MLIKEFYEKTGGDYNDVLLRLMKEERILKYLRMFANSSDYSDLLRSLSEKRYEDAFRSVHNLKGMSANLSLTSLFSVSSELCEALRNGKPTVDITGMLEAVQRKYEEILAAIRELD